jgi:hypothetical protein
MIVGQLIGDRCEPADARKDDAADRDIICPRATAGRAIHLPCLRLIATGGDV